MLSKILQKKIAWLSVSVLWLVVVLTLFGGGLAFAAEFGPVIKMNASGECVAPVEEMRRFHMQVLFDQRDRVVKQGIRDRTFSFDQCIRCHGSQNASGDYIPINNEGEFCQTCHAYASVKIDCFDCHANVPDSAMITGSF